MMNLRKELEGLFQYKSSNKQVQTIIDRGFVSSRPEKKELLYIGMNPSYTAGSKPESYIYEVEKAIVDYPKHYGNFDKLSEITHYKNNWTYIDLFFFRETDQKKLDVFFKLDIQFLVSQLLLTFKIIKYIDPKVIVVANSGASNFFGVNKKELSNNKFTNVWYGLNLYFDSLIGLYRVDGIHKDSLLSDFDTDYFNNKYLNIRKVT